MKYLKDKVSRLPLPVVPATLGLLVLGGFYETIGYPFVHAITAVISTVVALAYCLKIAFHLKSVIAAEYANPMLAALYPTLPMLIMVLCVYYAGLAPVLHDGARAVFFAMLGLLIVHVAVFFVRFFLRRFEWKTFMPSWYVTTNGVMVATVVGMPFMPEPLALGIVVWGIAAYVALTPFMLWRMKRCEVAEATMHSQAIMLGPCSMCLVSYVNVASEPNLIVLAALFACVAVSLAYVVAKLPKFFSVQFHPGFAGMTFPMAVGLLATHGFASTLAAAGFASAASMIQQVEGIQLLLATSIVAIVYARFLGMFAAGLKNDRVNGKLAPEQTAALRALRAYLKRGSDALEHPAKAEAFVPVAAGIDCNAACEEPGKAEER
ncbi:TDT family transporter [Paraeggerthella hongkongensis]|uniref:TDT family transporter n=1 Tax=Paraeggerthella TaxID=651554 RepID=UPI001C12544E|nr:MULTISPECIES: TDT family transporter [Paraeggerthella]MBU5405205.1 TDT family transporter [Paraeggerthella hongkongensis]MCD2433426.1 TDT family transporter [Paraeggerthella hominis]